MEGVIGYTTLFAGNFAPKAWAFCAGQIMPISQNTALFSILGTYYGGNGTSTFALPDLRGRAVAGAGQGPGLAPYLLGETVGVETTAIGITEMTQHGHAVQVTITPKGDNTVTTPNPVGATWGQGTELMFDPSADGTMKDYAGVLTMGLTGGGVPFSNLRPVLVLNYIICLQGVFPARN